MLYAIHCPTPVGPVTLTEENAALTGLRFGALPFSDTCREEETPLLRQAKQELEEYFAGQRRSFTVPLRPRGTPFQETVWQALTAIPYGELRTYGDIARQVGSPRGFRAVGMANNRNPISIMIPCHRVLGRNGSLTGFGGGLEAKAFLLRLEGSRLG